ncbi:MAG: PAS domain-containing sensor histidine kinase [Deltaproteobacteria bacterium]|nr:PAS domain-containing sensor histidine kinase [Deltaproteobacteria bacterium]
MTLDFHRLLAEYPLETLLQTIPTGLFLVDTDLRIAYWNAEAERITGYSAAEAVGRHCDFLEGIPCQEGCGLFNEQVQKPVTGISCSVQHKDGFRVELTKNIDLLRDEHGQVIGGIEAFVDISRLKKLEDSLRGAVAERTRELELEKAGLHSVLDGMTDPVYICAADFKITFINRAMRDIFGDINGQICYQAIHQESGVCAACPLPEVLSGRVVCRERDMEKTGRTYEIIHSPYPVADEPTHKLGVFRDITERKAAERRLRQANRELDAFVSTVSHDLRSPLTPLIGFAELLEERYADQLDEIGRESLGEIKVTATKMMVLLEDLLTLARVGQLKTPEQRVNVRLVAEDVLLELADKVVERQAKVKIAPLPDVRIPESLLNDLFRNLLANALNYAAEQDPRIEIRGEEFTDRVRYRVIDHGPGIPAEEQDLVFEPFRRGSSSRGVSGTGVGLATVAKIARVYNGSAWVEQTPGGGATFVVELAKVED